jgi:ABC-type enterobactin transport system permease subunit
MGRILDKSQDMDDKNGIKMNKIIIIIIIIAITLATIVVDYIDNI